jgi:hypothetical protein
VLKGCCLSLFELWALTGEDAVIQIVITVTKGQTLLGRFAIRIACATARIAVELTKLRLMAMTRYGWWFARQQASIQPSGPYQSWDQRW